MGAQPRITYRWANIAGIVYTFALIIGIYSVVLLHTCPATFPNGNECSIGNYAGIVIVTEIVANYILLRVYASRNEPQRWVNYMSSLTHSSWTGKFCIDCNRHVPKRSHHCPVCSVCVIRRDHHCFMTGGCVGIANQRFFIVFVLWSCIGTALGSYFIALYLHKFIEPYLLPLGWTKFLAPVAVIRWFLSVETFANTALCVLFSICTATSIVALIFFVSQIYYTLNGFTMHEYHSINRRIDFQGDGERYSERLQLIFGQYWAINFIVPLLNFPNRLTPDIVRNLSLSNAKDM